jgi:hypothetical protein
MARIPLKPEAVARIEQARHNYGLYETLRNEGSYTDWAVTALFYAALHLVEAHAIEHDHPLDPTHLGRRAYLWRYLPQVASRYRRLEDASREARYELWHPSLEELLTLHTSLFRAIETRLWAARIHL